MTLKLEHFLATRKGRTQGTYARARPWYSRPRSLAEPIRPWREPLTGIWKDIGKKAG